MTKEGVKGGDEPSRWWIVICVNSISGVVVVVVEVGGGGGERWWVWSKQWDVEGRIGGGCERASRSIECRVFMASGI